MKLTLNSNNTTETPPDVVMERDLAEWLLGLVDVIPNFLKRYRVTRRDSTPEA